jgi:hypothetical protein
MSDLVSHKLCINDLLARFFQSFDEKDWALMRACLSSEVYADYSSFRGIAPGIMSGDEYVEGRRAVLQSLDMQHNFSNLRVEVDMAAENAIARCNYAIHRFLPSYADGNDHYFHSYGYYLITCSRASGSWKISRITQKVLHSQGRREIHLGARSNGQAS